MNRRQVLREVESRFGLGIACVLGAGLLSASFLGVELAVDLLIGSLARLVAGVWFLVRGGRELTVDANSVAVTRREVARLSGALGETAPVGER